VYVLAGRKGAELHGPWTAMARPRLAGLDLSVLKALMASDKYYPSFLMPTPLSAKATFAEEVERVRAAEPAVVHRYFATCWPDGEIPPLLRPLSERPGRELGRLADTLVAYWNAAIEPVWPRLCALHDADVAHRSAALTLGGISRLFVDLHPQVEYADDRLRIHLPLHDAVHTIDGTGVLLIPSAFVWPKVQMCDIAPAHLCYPARGLGQVWAKTPRVATAPLAELLGRSRAALLALLDLPQSTTQLAASLGVAPATVSEHLAVLRRSRLVDSRRAGRSVLYERTSLGSLLLLEHT
jgi:DNA-binding transcriptional ArsR family regulator